MISYKDAQALIASHAASFGTETVPLQLVLGRIIAEPVMADRDYPPFNRATMDGYALRLEDLKNGIRNFMIAETIFAGEVTYNNLEAGSCYKIMTGAPVPESANIVIRREDTSSHGNTVRMLSEDHKLFQNIARQGEDIKAHAQVLTPPIKGTPAVISALAALGKASVKVQKLPRVALFTTGNEVVSINEPVSASQIRNSNEYLLKSLLKQWNIEPFICQHIKDDKADLEKIIKEGLAGNIVIISGGVSAGDADFVPEILEKLGVKKLFHKVAMKPGKPIWCGRVDNGAMVFALPGNPFSSMVDFILFVETYLADCLGSTASTVTLPFAGERTKTSNLDEFFPVIIRPAPFEAAPISFNGSGDILAALVASGIAHHPAPVGSLTPGMLVTISVFKG